MSKKTFRDEDIQLVLPDAKKDFKEACDQLWKEIEGLIPRDGKNCRAYFTFMGDSEPELFICDIKPGGQSFVVPLSIIEKYQADSFEEKSEAKACVEWLRKLAGEIEADWQL